jgi:hypothetical protein
LKSRKRANQSEQPMPFALRATDIAIIYDLQKKMNQPDLILEIGIDKKERLYVKPENESYPTIFLEGVEVQWDDEGRFLYSPKPREWSYFDWFTHILSVADPVADSLMISEETKWKEIPEELKFRIEAWMDNREPQK